MDLWINFLPGQHVHKLCHRESPSQISPILQRELSQVNASVFTLLAMTVERYRAIMTPLAPRNSHTTLWIGIGLVWSCSAILALPSAFASNIFVQVSIHKRVRHVIIIIITIITIVIIIRGGATPLIVTTAFSSGQTEFREGLRGTMGNTQKHLFTISLQYLFCFPVTIGCC